VLDLEATVEVLEMRLRDAEDLILFRAMRAVIVGPEPIGPTVAGSSRVTTKPIRLRRALVDCLHQAAICGLRQPIVIARTSTDAPCRARAADADRGPDCPRARATRMRSHAT
jgi:hypothetical protein